jgi:hypothetical protein
MDVFNRLRYVLILLYLIGLPLLAVVGLRRPGQDEPLQPLLDGTRSVSATLAVSQDGGVQRLPVLPLEDQDWFVSAQRQLQSLGAVYVRLEKWLSEPPVYYFECRLDPASLAFPATAAYSGARDGPTALAGLSTSPQQATLDVLRRLQDRHRLPRLPQAAVGR